MIELFSVYIGLRAGESLVAGSSPDTGKIPRLVGENLGLRILPDYRLTCFIDRKS